MINYEDTAKLTKHGMFVSNISPQQASKIMVVDDQYLSLLHAVDLIKYEGYEIIETNDSSKAVSIAFQEQPDVILVDVVMPGINGLELAKQLKLHPQTQSIPIILMSVNEEQEIKEQAMSIGVDDFITKPLDRFRLSRQLKSLVQQKRLNEGLNQTQKVLLSLATAIENRSVEEKESSFNLANLVMNFGQYLQLNDDDVQDLVFSAYLHDIGTVSIPEHILTKTEKLTAQENEVIRQHVIIGEQICKPLTNRPNLLGIIRHHHEKYDGSGYPDNLQKEEIPFLAQVFQIADIYHALTSERSYKPAYGNDESLEILADETQRGWRNPQIFEQFKQFIPTYLAKFSN